MVTHIQNDRNSNFPHRFEAGKILGESLGKYKDHQPIILALPRGGVVVGYEVAKRLNAPLDVLVSKKIVAPHFPELSIGAVAEQETLILDSGAIGNLEISKYEVTKAIQQAQKEATRQIQLFRNNLPLPVLEGKTVIIVDDGLATGITAEAAVTEILGQRPEIVVFASPVCSPFSLERLESKVDEMVCILKPHNLRAVGQYYHQFEQVKDEEVIRLLQNAREYKKDYYYAQ